MCDDEGSSGCEFRVRVHLVMRLHVNSQLMPMREWNMFGLGKVCGLRSLVNRELVRAENGGQSRL